MEDFIKPDAFRVTLYHGPNKKLGEKLEKFCIKQDNSIFFYNGDINHFIYDYRDKFIHDGPQDHDHYGHEIYVTHRMGWDKNSPILEQFKDK